MVVEAETVSRVVVIIVASSVGGGGMVRVDTKTLGGGGIAFVEAKTVSRVAVAIVTSSVGGDGIAFVETKTVSRVAVAMVTSLVGGEDVKSIMTESWAVAPEGPGDAKTVLVDGGSDVKSGNKLDGLAGVPGEASVSAERPPVLPLDMMACFWEKGYGGGDNGLEILPVSLKSENATAI